jgi:hypothetical protein
MNQSKERSLGKSLSGTLINRDKKPGQFGVTHPCEFKAHHLERKGNLRGHQDEDSDSTSVWGWL